jgi:ABC-type amino acid transport substrate-binding protein
MDLNLLYNSDQFAVVQIDWPAAAATRAASGETGLARGGYEIVDKFARKGLFIEGVLAQHFREGVQALVDGQPDADVLDAFIGRYTELAQQPVVMH